MESDKTRKKSNRQLFIETWTKTRKERYDEMTKGGKIGYRICCVVFFSYVLAGLLVLLYKSWTNN